MSVETAEAPAVAQAATVPDDHVIVLFGATGDLARRKLLPGLFHLAEAGLMPERFVIVGASRGEMIDDEFAALAREAVEDCGHGPVPDSSWERFAASLRAAHVGDGYDPLSEVVREAESELGGEPRLLHYLSLPPSAHAGVIESLGAAGLSARSRIILEKPFGTDLASARSLDDLLHRVFDEDQIFRIDHYLGPRRGPEPAGDEVRERDVRAGLEPQPGQPRSDRRPGDARDRDAGRLLRADRGLPRHGRHPPLPGARVRRDGAAERARPRRR